MSPAVRAAIDAAEDLAWRPTYNLPGSLRYHDRQEAAQRLRDLLARVRRLASDASHELRLLIAAMRRAAAATYANRKGPPYYERKQAIYELRGCLVVWKRSVADG